MDDFFQIIVAIFNFGFFNSQRFSDCVQRKTNGLSSCIVHHYN